MTIRGIRGYKQGHVVVWGQTGLQGDVREAYRAPGRHRELWEGIRGHGLSEGVI